MSETTPRGCSEWLHVLVFGVFSTFSVRGFFLLLFAVIQVVPAQSWRLRRQISQSSYVNTTWILIRLKMRESDQDPQRPHGAHPHQTSWRGWSNLTWSLSAVVPNYTLCALFWIRLPFCYQHSDPVDLDFVPITRFIFTPHPFYCSSSICSAVNCPSAPPPTFPGAAFKYEFKFGSDELLEAWYK